MKVLSNIHALRALAVLLVAWVHIAEIFPNDGFYERFSRYGFAGVDLFFVISGFIMIYISSMDFKGPAHFLLDRFLRISPMYYAFTALVAFLAFSAPDIFKSTVVGPESLLKSALFIPFEKSPGRVYPLYIIGWTLNYEMYFYVLFAVASFISFKFRALILVTFIFIMIFIGFILSDDFLRENIILYTYTRPIIGDFALGVIVGVLYIKGVSFGPKAAYTTILFSLFICAFLSWKRDLGDGIFQPPTATLIPFGISCAMLTFSALSLERCGIVSKSKLVFSIGLSSFSIYLSHYFVAEFIVKLSQYYRLDLALNICLTFVFYLVVPLVGYLVFFTLERPVHRFTKRATIRNRELQ